MLLWAALAIVVPPIRLQVDASNCANGIVYIEELIQVKSGKFDLVFPRWTPWTHAPSKRINTMINLHFSANNHELIWRRDEKDMNLFHLNIPEGQTTVKVNFDHVFTYGDGATESLAYLDFIDLVIYPKGADASVLSFSPSLKLPDGWKYGTGLKIEKERLGFASFHDASLLDLVENPIIAGANFAEIPIGIFDGRSHFLDVASDDASGKVVPSETITSIGRLVQEAGTLFGARHYNQYRWLVSISETLPGRGWEHHECSENGTVLGGLGTNFGDFGSLLAHEYVHSWCGKYRRPVGEVTKNYQEPLMGNLLWVYEGLTEYLGTVLSVRSGISSSESVRSYLSTIGSNLDHMPGKGWRSIEDVCISAQLFGPGDSFRNFRRGQDYYSEGVLLWLDVDTKIRQITDNRKSLDDFCKGFLGGKDSGPEVRSFNEQDLVGALEKVAKFRWAEYFKDRVQKVQPRANLEGIVNSGWQLTYGDTDEDAETGDASPLNLTNGFGAWIAASGYVYRPLPGSPADSSGLREGTTIQNVNGMPYSAKGMRTAIMEAESGKSIELTIKHRNETSHISINYRGGLMQPRLERNSTKPDLLSSILRSRSVRG